MVHLWIEQQKKHALRLLFSSKRKFYYVEILRELSRMDKQWAGSKEWSKDNEGNWV